MRFRFSSLSPRVRRACCCAYKEPSRAARRGSVAAACRSHHHSSERQRAPPPRKDTRWRRGAAVCAGVLRRHRSALLPQRSPFCRFQPFACYNPERPFAAEALSRPRFAYAIRHCLLFFRECDIHPAQYHA